jgi:hypothetical protein
MIEGTSSPGHRHQLPVLATIPRPVQSSGPKRMWIQSFDDCIRRCVREPQLYTCLTKDGPYRVKFMAPDFGVANSTLLVQRVNI